MVIHPSSLTVRSSSRPALANQGSTPFYISSPYFTLSFIFLSGRRQNEKSGSRNDAENEELPRGRLDGERGGTPPDLAPLL